MATPLQTAWRSFWHTMTSNDRHASHDSPYRTGQHVPLNQSRHSTLTSVATSAVESRPDLTSPYEDEISRQPTNGWPGSPSGVASPTRPYSPGMRSFSSQQRKSHDQGTDGASPGEIQMQSFHDGAPPPPPVSHSWKKIDGWAERNYEELFDQLCEGCTQNDVNELEHELDCSLPLEVRESLQFHDGQERGGMPTGILFGCMLLDCEEIVQEWKNWRVVNEEYLSTATVHAPAPPIKAFGGTSTSATPSSSRDPAGRDPTLWRQELLDKQDSQPPRAIQKAYAHPSWIPLARDWGGNNLAVDLAPGPAGKWGQVIIFGRDYDCKYVVARSWAVFLAMVADDLTGPNAVVDEETGELKLKLFKRQNVEPPYLEILRWRTDQKHGRRPPRRKPTTGLGVNTNMASKSNRGSPYGSPTPSEERGRSPHRSRGRGPNASPKAQFSTSSPLARVTEETSSPVTGGDKIQDFARTNTSKTAKSDDLLDVATPVVPNKEDDKENLLTDLVEDDSPREKKVEPASEATKEAKIGGLDKETLDGMKNVEI